MDRPAQCCNTSSTEVGMFEEWWGEVEEGPPLQIPEGRSVNSFLEDCEFVPADSSNLNTSASISKQQDTFLLHERMRRKLVYHFMNPIEKWQTKRRFPWKLCVQIVKIIFITVQMTLFGMSSHEFVRRHQDVSVSLGHIFLLDWTPNFAVYPPSSGPYAVYTIPEFYDNVDNIVKQYSKISIFSIGSYSYDNPNGTMTPLRFCIDKYKKGDVSPSNETINIINVVEHQCLDVPPLYPAGDPLWETFSMEKLLAESNITLHFATIVQIELTFSLKTILLKTLSKLDVPECYRLHLSVLYDNHYHDGQMTITFSIKSNKRDCNVTLSHTDLIESRHYIFHQLLNSSVIVLCITSLILCGRSLHSSYQLNKKATEFFKLQFNRQLPASEKLDFVDFWYVMIVVSDALVICGSVIKIQIEEHHQSGPLYNHCCMLLGVGNLLVWVGILRYLGFFKKYNMLILTLKCALPNVLRFLLCAVFLYAGFCFCGWVVLGPYHVKFESLSRTSECLFAVMNGDDMFATFALLNDEDNVLLWWFSRAYLYSFLVLFIYVVISLFISVIMDTFETIKIIYEHGSLPKTTVELFLYGDLPRPPQSNVSQESHAPTDTRSLDVLKAVFVKILSRLKTPASDSQPALIPS